MRRRHGLGRVRAVEWRSSGVRRESRLFGRQRGGDRRWRDRGTGRRHERRVRDRSDRDRRRCRLRSMHGCGNGHRGRRRLRRGRDRSRRQVRDRAELGIHRCRRRGTILALRAVLERQEDMSVARQHGGHRLVSGLVAHDHPLRIERLTVHEQQHARTTDPTECDAVRAVDEHGRARKRLPRMAPQLGLREQQAGQRVM